MVGHFAIDVSTRCNQHIAAHLYASHDGGIHANPNIVPDGGRAFALAAVLLTDGHALVDIAISANLSARIDGNVERVT